MVVWWVWCNYLLYRFGYQEMMGDSEKERCVVIKVQISWRDRTEDGVMEDELEVIKDSKVNPMGNNGKYNAN